MRNFQSPALSICVLAMTGCNRGEIQTRTGTAQMTSVAIGGTPLAQKEGAEAAKSPSTVTADYSFGVKRGNTYYDARRILQEHGLQPVSVVGQVDVEFTPLPLEDFPEELNCYPTGMGECEFLFQDKSTKQYCILTAQGEGDDENPAKDKGVTGLYKTKVKRSADGTIDAYEGVSSVGKNLDPSWADDIRSSSLR